MILRHNKKKLLSILLTLAMLAGLMPWSVMTARAEGDETEPETGTFAELQALLNAAAENGGTAALDRDYAYGGSVYVGDGEAELVTSYPLWVEGEWVTGNNTSGTGWSYDAENRILTLDGYSYTGAASIEFDEFDATYYAAIGWFGADELTVELKGENSVTEDISDIIPEITSGTDTEAMVNIDSCGIYASVAALSFTGGGSLEVTGSGGTSSNYGVSCDGGMTVSGGTELTAAGGDVTGGYGSYGVYCYGLTVSEGSTLNAAGGEAGFDSCGVLCAENLTVEGDSKLTAVGDNVTAAYSSSRSLGVGCGTLSVTGSGSSLAASAGSAKGNSYGIFAFNGLTADAAATLTAAGEKRAIYGEVQNAAAGMGSKDGSTWETIPANAGIKDSLYKTVSFPQLTVSFDANDGTSDPATAEQSMPYGFAAALDENKFTREGYKFIGWNTEKTPTEEKPGTAYDDKAELTLTQNTALYARWEKILPFVMGERNADGELIATVIAPEGGILIAAAYDEDGRLASVWTVSADKSDAAQEFKTGIVWGESHTCRLMLVDGSYAPLCEAGE